MLRISVKPADDGAATLMLEGRATGPWVEELRRVSQAVLDRHGRLTLDLAELSFLDRDAVALLRQLAARGARLRGATGLVTEQLKETS